MEFIPKGRFATVGSIGKNQKLVLEKTTKDSTTKVGNGSTCEINTQLFQVIADEEILLI